MLFLHIGAIGHPRCGDIVEFVRVLCIQLDAPKGASKGAVWWLISFKCFFNELKIATFKADCEDDNAQESQRLCR